MGRAIGQEGPIDFILAGLKGATGGVSKGLTARQARLERQAAAKTLAEFRRTTLALQEQGIDIQKLEQESLDRFRDAQIAEREAARLAAVPPLTFEQRKELKGIGPTVVPTALDVEEQKADIAGKVIDTTLKKEANIRAERRVRMEESRDDLAVDKFNEEKLQTRTDRLFDVVKAEFDQKSEIWMEQFKNNLSQAAGDLTQAEKAFFELSLGVIQFAIEEKSDFAIAEAGRYAKQAAKIFADKGLSMPPGVPTFVPDRSFLKGFGIFGAEKIQEPTELPQEVLPLPPFKPAKIGEPPSFPQGDQNILDALQLQLPSTPASSQAPTSSTTRSAFDEPDAIIEEPKLPQPAMPQVVDIIQDLQIAGKVTISDQFKLQLGAAGVSDSDIDIIESSISTKPDDAFDSESTKKDITKIPKTTKVPTLKTRRIDRARNVTNEHMLNLSNLFVDSLPDKQIQKIHKSTKLNELERAIMIRNLSRSSEGSPKRNSDESMDSVIARIIFNIRRSSNADPSKIARQLETLKAIGFSEKQIDKIKSGGGVGGRLFDNANGDE